MEAAHAVEVWTSVTETPQKLCHMISICILLVLVLLDSVNLQKRFVLCVDVAVFSSVVKLKYST